MQVAKVPTIIPPSDTLFGELVDDDGKKQHHTIIYLDISLEQFISLAW